MANDLQNSALSRTTQTLDNRNDTDLSLSVISYNMHGFNQGMSTIRDLCLSTKPDIFMLQEHWLPPCNLNRFDKMYLDYFTFGSSAMISSTESGLLSGRPFGGVMMLINKDLQRFTQTLYSSERCIIVKILNYLLVNVYLPCTGTVNRLLLIEDVLNDISNYLSDYRGCTLLIGGDFNCDLDGISQAAEVINNFASDSCLVRCDKLAGCHKSNTYVNTALDCSSCVDYFLLSDTSKFIKFEVLDEGSNLSDHLPITLQCRYDHVTVNDSKPATDKTHQTYLRWDHADITGYYLLTGQHLQPLLDEFVLFNDSCLNCSADNERVNAVETIDNVYNRIVSILCDAAKLTVPVRSKQFYKFWWDQELDCLKEDSISSHNLWKAAGKPRSGSLFTNARQCKLLYKKRIRECQRQETSSYTNDLHAALVHKEGNAFWKCWRSKFDSSNKQAGQVNGLTDEQEITDKFAEHFSKTCDNLTVEGSKRLTEIYNNRRPSYSGIPFDDYLLFDVELVDKSVRSLGRGKAAGLDNLTAEHLQHSHPALFSLLHRLFNLMVKYAYVPCGFGLSYTVPLPKNSYAGVSKSVAVDDFRGICISPVLSKVFEKCVLDRYQRFFETSDSQYGFKKGIGCSHAIYTVKNVVDHFVRQGSTVNLCALDLKKAFDKMNHHGLFIKLMDRMLPNKLLATLEYWFSICFTCVRWGAKFSGFFKLVCGIRQGGVLSPHLFAVYIDDLIKLIQSSNVGCMIGVISMNIFVYADDIILLAPSVGALQHMISVCETHLAYLDMTLNTKKCVCLRIGARYKDDCCSIITLSGESLCWVDNCRYLGVYLVTGKQFQCSISNNKKSFYRSFNAVYSKVGCYASEEVLVKLIATKCLPVLVYGLDACPVTTTHKHTLDFIMARTFMRIFKTNSIAIVHECYLRFNFRKVSDVVARKKINFLRRFAESDNAVCNFFADYARNEFN